MATQEFLSKEKCEAARLVIDRPKRTVCVEK